MHACMHACQKQQYMSYINAIQARTHTCIAFHSCIKYIIYIRYTAYVTLKYYTIHRITSRLWTHICTHVHYTHFIHICIHPCTNTSHVVTTWYYIKSQYICTHTCTHKRIHARMHRNFALHTHKNMYTLHKTNAFIQTLHENMHEHIQKSIAYIHQLHTHMQDINLDKIALLMCTHANTHTQTCTHTCICDITQIHTCIH